MSTCEKTRLLCERLDAISKRFSREPGALGLLALGSVGVEQERLDGYSDLDFFAIVTPERKSDFLLDTSWMEVTPIDFIFQNTTDGFKLMYADGIYGEMALFTPEELRYAAYAPGRWVWRDEALDERLRVPQSVPPPSFHSRSDAWLAGELVTCLYVGLCRYLRGEKASAFRFVQVHCVDFLLALHERRQRNHGRRLPDDDLFVRERRCESRFPELASELPRWMPGWERTPEAIEAILSFACGHWSVPEAMVLRMRSLLAMRDERLPK